MTIYADPEKKPIPSHRCRWIIVSSAIVGSALFAIFGHSFLAINEPVPADILVVEGWVPEYVLVQASREFQKSGYTRVYTSGLEFERGDPSFSEGSFAARAARRLVALGLPPSAVEACPAPVRSWNRTSTMARTVCDRVRLLNLHPKGMNVITLGPHARQSRLAYQRMLGVDTPVGVISVAKDDYVASHWWTSTTGIYKTTKDFAGWAKELILGPRS